MDSKTKTIWLLLPLTFLWFFTGIGNGFMLPFMFGAYGEIAEPNWMMQATIGGLIFFPMICVSTVIGGWRLLIGGRYGTAIKVALIPFPILVLVIALYKGAGWP